MKNKSIVILILVVFVFACKRHKNFSPAEIVNESINFHDPKGEWKNFNYELTFIADKANGSDVNTTIEINNRKDYFRYIQKEARTDVGIERDSCFTYSAEPVDCRGTKSTRDYWLFLLGLPMKLLDEGTVLDSDVVEERFEGYNCYKIKVQYPKDVWYFYFDKVNFQLRGKIFYVDEEKALGEKIILKGLTVINGLKLFSERKWIRTHDSVYVATDKLLDFKSLND